MEHLTTTEPEREHGADAGAPDELAPEAQGDAFKAMEIPTP
jgi:hypothetical protein